MKNRYSFFTIIFCLAMSLFQGCGKDDVNVNPNYGDIAYKVVLSGMEKEGSDDKAVFNSNDYLKLLFEEGDEIRINGVRFTLHKNNSGVWYAHGNTADMNSTNHDTLLGNTFACYYGQSPATTNPSYGGLVYSGVSFTGASSQDPDHSTMTHRTPGIILAGMTSDSLINLYPGFAIIRIVRSNAYLTGYSFDYIALGFDADKVVRYANVTPNSDSYPTLTNPIYLAAVDTIQEPDPVFPDEVITSYIGDFLLASEEDINENTVQASYSYHVIVPLATTVTTNIYLKARFLRLSNSTTYTRYKKFNDVTLQPGRVYTINL